MSKQKYTAEEIAVILEEQGIHIEEVGKALRVKRLLQKLHTLDDIYMLLDHLPSLSKNGETVEISLDTAHQMRRIIRNMDTMAAHHYNKCAELTEEKKALENTIRNLEQQVLILSNKQPLDTIIPHYLGEPAPTVGIRLGAGESK